MSHPSSESKDGIFTVIRPRFLCEDMGHDSYSSVLVGTFPRNPPDHGTITAWARGDEHNRFFVLS